VVVHLADQLWNIFVIFRILVANWCHRPNGDLARIVISYTIRFVYLFIIDIIHAANAA